MGGKKESHTLKQRHKQDTQRSMKQRWNSDNSKAQRIDSEVSGQRQRQRQRQRCVGPRVFRISVGHQQARINFLPIVIFNQVLFCYLLHTVRREKRFWPAIHKSDFCDQTFLSLLVRVEHGTQ